jgi:uncharacterized protein (TIGR03437 family)
LNLLGAQTPNRIVGRDEFAGTSNYFVGNDPAQWRTQVPNYARVEYDNIYPGIDVVYYGQQQQLEYDFVVAPHANPDLIRLQVQGADTIRLDAQGDLLLGTDSGEVRQHKPVAYQIINGQRREIAARYVLHKNQIRFRLGAYDRRHSLVIDPVLVYSTYLGGSGTETGRAIAVDKDGNAYVVGETFSNDFPGSSPLQPIRGVAGEAFVLKLNAAGSQVVYATWLGGGGDDQARNVVVDTDGNAYVAGATFSNNFPTTNGALQSTRSADGDVFVAKLNPAGTALLYSTLLGGNGNDTAFDLAVDGNGNAYVAGSTLSTNLPATGLQTMRRGNSLYRSTNQGGSWTGANGLQAPLTNSLTFDPSNANTVYAATNVGVFKSTDGGTTWQRLGLFQGAALNTYTVAVHPMTPTTLYAGTAGALFKSTDGGATWMFQQVPLTGLPFFFSVVFDPTNPETVYTGTGGGVFKTTNGGAAWTGVNSGMATFPGGSNLPQVNRLMMDRTTPTTLYAATTRGFFKTTNGGTAWVKAQQGLTGTSTVIDANVRELVADPSSPLTFYALSLSPVPGLYKTTDGAMTWSLITNGIPITSGGNTFTAQIAYLVVDPATPTTLYAGIPNVGVFKSIDGGTNWSAANTGLNNLQVSSLTVERNGAILATTNSGSDGFVAKLNPTASALAYLTYLGGDESDTATALALDKDGNVVVAGVTSARNFPTANPLQTANAGGADAFIAKLNGAGSALLWSTYLGGASNDNVIDLALNAAGQVYVTGTTGSTNFPLASALQNASKGGNESFVARLRADGSGLDFSTYLGGARNDTANGLALDAAGNIYVTGTTDSTDFPLADPVQTSLNGVTTPSNATDAFVTKLNPTASALVYSTYLGGLSSDSALGIAVDPLGQVYITGFTGSPNFPLVNPIQVTLSASDLFIAKLGVNADLTVIQSQLRNPVLVNNNQTYNITATNDGPSPATGVLVSDTLPTGMTFVSATPSQGSCAHNSGVVTCNLGNLDKQKSATITLIVTPTVVGKINHTVTITSSDPDSNSSNNRSVLETTVSALPSIGGRVTDGGGKGLAGVLLTVNATPPNTVLTDSDGYYQTAELTLGGNFTITPSSNSYSFEPASRSYENLRADQTANFTATVCKYEIFPTTQEFTAAGGSGSFSILATARCPWTAVVNPEAASWLRVPPGSTGTGNGAIIFTVAPTTTSRSGRITIGDQTFTVFQRIATCSTPGFLQKGYFTGSGIDRVELADFNGDGRTDLAVAARGPEFDNTLSSFVQRVRILASDASGSFSELSVISMPGFFSSEGVPFMTGDFNGDQKPDIALFNSQRRRLELSINQGNGRFAAPRFTSPAIAPSYSADVNGDGRVDLLAPNGAGVSIMLNQGDSFGVPYSVTLNGLVQAITDFNSDGLPDVLAYSSSFSPPRLFLYPGDGIGSFQRAIETQISDFPTMLNVTDFNTDGKPDLVYVGDVPQGNNQTLRQISVRLNDGTGRFSTAAATLPQTLPPASLVVADLNGDARLDVVTSELTPTNFFPRPATDPIKLFFFPGDGTGKLGSRVEAGDIRPGVQLMTGDFNGDGRADLASFERTQTVINTHLNLCANIGGPVIFGRVTDGDLPIGMRDVTIKISGSSTATTQTDSNGNYALGGLTAGGNYTITAERNGVEFAPPDKAITNLMTDQRVDFIGTRVAVAVSSASYARGVVGRDSLISLFGMELSEQTESATTSPLPTTLGGVFVQVSPKNYGPTTASLLYVSPTQINFLLPPLDPTAMGPLTIRVFRTGTFTPQIVSTGLFTANASGSGAPAGNIVFATGGTLRNESAGVCNANGCVPREIDLSAVDEVYLELYGTGIRNFAQPVTATLGGDAIPVVFAGKQNDFAGLDQVNVRIPKTFAKRGELDLVLTVDGKRTNAVRVKIK